MALVFAAATLGAQTAKPGANQTQEPAPYVPAVMQARMAKLSGCLQQKQDTYILSGVTLAQAGAAAGTDVQTRAGVAKADAAKPEIASTYTVEGLSPLRLTLYVGKRVEVTGAFQSAAAANGMPRFEATDLTELEGTCQ
jgi:hypothetical protein